MIESNLKNQLGDAQIASMGWTETGDDFWISFILPDKSTMKIIFCWVSELYIDFNFNGYSGMPLVFEYNIKSTDNNAYAICISFEAAPEGKIEFKCNELQLPKEYIASTDGE